MQDYQRAVYKNLILFFVFIFISRLSFFFFFFAVSRIGRRGYVKVKAEGKDIFTGEPKEQIFFARLLVLPTVIQTDYKVEHINKETGEAKLSNKFEGSQRTLALPQGDLGDTITNLWDDGIECFTVTVMEAYWSSADGQQLMEEVAITSAQRKDK